MEFSTISLASFMAVANLGSIASASQYLNVAGSVLSRNIKRMEDVLGVALFERSPKGMKLTPAGQSFAAYVRRAKLDQDEAVAQLQRRSQTTEGHIRVSATEGLSLSLVPQLAAEFQAMHPRVSFDLMTRAQPDIFRAVENGDSDIGLTFEGRSGPEIDIIHREPFRSFAVMSPSHPLADDPTLTLEKISAYPLTGSRETTTSTLQDRVVSMAGVRMEFGLTTNNTTAMYNYCSRSEAINFSAFASFYHFLDNGSIIARDFVGSEHMKRSVLISVLKGRKIPQHMEHFLQHASARLAELAKRTAR